MFYSYKNYKNKGRNYKIGFAENHKNQWKRKDNKLLFKKSSNNFDKNMQEYASVIKYDNEFFMFYNGDNYGQRGIGLAKLLK